MKLAILGATGQTGEEGSLERILMIAMTGKQVVLQALEKGHMVTAIVRSPDKVQTSHDNLKVVTADIFNTEQLREHFVDQDAILSCLGFKPEKPKTTLVKLRATA